MWMVLITSDMMAVDDLAKQFATFLSADVKDGVPVNGS